MPVYPVPTLGRTFTELGEYVALATDLFRKVGWNHTCNELSS
jgi:hypothetical protein